MCPYSKTCVCVPFVPQGEHLSQQLLGSRWVPSGELEQQRQRRRPLLPVWGQLDRAGLWCSLLLGRLWSAWQGALPEQELRLQERVARWAKFPRVYCSDWILTVPSEISNHKFTLALHRCFFRKLDMWLCEWATEDLLTTAFFSCKVHQQHIFFYSNCFKAQQQQINNQTLMPLHTSLSLLL